MPVNYIFGAFFIATGVVMVIQGLRMKFRKEKNNE